MHVSHIRGCLTGAEALVFLLINFLDVHYKLHDRHFCANMLVWARFRRVWILRTALS